MSNQHSVYKAQMNVRIPHELFVKTERRAQEIGVTTADVVTLALMDYTKNVKLEPEDYEEIARRVALHQERAAVARERGKARAR